VSSPISASRRIPRLLYLLPAAFHDAKEGAADIGPAAETHDDRRTVRSGAGGQQSPDHVRARVGQAALHIEHRDLTIVESLGHGLLGATR